MAMRKKAPLEFEFASSAHLDMGQFLRNLKAELARKLRLNPDDIRPLPLGRRGAGARRKRRSVFDAGEDAPSKFPPAAGINTELVEVRVENGERIERVGLGIYPEHLGAGLTPASWDDTSLAPVPLIEAEKIGQVNQTVASVKVHFWHEFLPERRRFWGLIHGPALTLRELRSVLFKAARAVR